MSNLIFPLGYFSSVPIAMAYAANSAYPGGIIPANTLASPYQFHLDQAALGYHQQIQQFPAQMQTQSDPNIYQAHLLKLLAFRQAQAQAQAQTNQVNFEIFY